MTAASDKHVSRVNFEWLRLGLGWLRFGSQ